MKKRTGRLVDEAKHGALALALVLGTGAAAAAVEAVVPQPGGMSPLGAYLSARHAQHERDYVTAAAFAGRALASDPGNAELVRRTFLFRVGAGEVNAALPLATRIVDLDSRSGFADLLLALQQLKAGHYRDALVRAHALPQDGVERLMTPLLAAWAKVGLGETKSALQGLTELTPGSIPELAQLHRALIADQAGRIDDAAAQYDKLIHDTAHLTWRTIELAGNFYERHQRSIEAKRLYQRLKSEVEGGSITEAALKRIADGVIPAPLIATPQDGAAEALFDLASVLNQHETIDAALFHARLALYMRPNFPIAELLLAEIADEENHSRDALAFYRAIDTASPLAWSGRLREATILDVLGKTQDAETLLRAMAAERPRDRQPLVELADILRGHDRFKEAVAAYDQAFDRVGQTEPGDWRLYYSRGVALERAQQWPRAEADLRHALALAPQEPLVLNYLGYSWIDQGVHLDKALQMVERAVALRPGDGYIVDSLGWAFYRLGNYARATDNLERAIELVPEDPTINDHLGDVYWRTGRHLEARFQWHRALQFKPDPDETTKIEAKLAHGLGQAEAGPASRGG